MADAVDFELEVLREDLRIQEAYHELELPLESHRRGPHPGRPGHAGVAPGAGRPRGRRRGGGPDVTAVTVVDHPVLAHRVTQLRDRHTGGDTFRQLVSEVSGFLAYEALRDLGHERGHGRHARGRRARRRAA